MKIDQQLSLASAGRRPARSLLLSHAFSPGQMAALDFIVPAEKAAGVRGALAAVPDCSVRSCTPHPARKEVSLRIAFPGGTQRQLMDVLMASVPGREFGRIAHAAGAHESTGSSFVTPSLGSMMLSLAFLLAAALWSPPANAQAGPGRPEDVVQCVTEALDSASLGHAIAAGEKWRACHSADAQRNDSGIELLQRSLYVPIRHRIVDVTVRRDAAGSAIVRGELQAWHVRKGGASLESYGTWEAEVLQEPASWRIARERLVPIAGTETVWLER